MARNNSGKYIFKIMGIIHALWPYLPWLDLCRLDSPLVEFKGQKMSDIEFFAKAKGMKTFKEHEQDRLLKSMVMSASELAKRKQEVEERAKAFTRAAAVEEFVNSTERPVSPIDPTLIGQRVGVITREPYEEQP